MKYRLLLLFACLGMWSRASGKFVFYDKDSGLELTGTSSLTFYSNTVAPVSGMVLREPGATIAGHPFYFENGVLSDGDYDILLSATYDSMLSTSVILHGGTGPTQSFFYVTNPGRIPYKMKVLGTNNRIEGVPDFILQNAFEMSNHLTTVAISIQSELDQSFILNGGSVLLDDNLRLSDNVKLTGSGAVDYNGYNLYLGEKDLLWTNTLLMKDASNLEFRAKNSLRGMWIFDGDAHVLGNNHVLDLTGGGKLLIKSGTTVKFSNVKIKGLGSGDIIFEDKTSQLKLFRCNLDVDDDYTFTTGGVYVEGPVVAVTRNKVITFDQHASLTVDGVAMVYDTLDYFNRDNIRTFTDKGTYLNGPNYGFLNGGLIRKKRFDRIGDQNYYSDMLEAFDALDRDIVISDQRKLIVHRNTEVDGNGQFVTFSRHSKENIIVVQPGKTLKITNALLKDFPSQRTLIDTGGRMIFGDQTTVELGESALIDDTWEFEGTVVLNGMNKTLELGTNGKLLIRPGSEVLFDNIRIRGVESGRILCMDNSSTVSFGNAELIQSGNYTFSNGRLEIVGLCELKGTYTFDIANQQTNDIRPFGTIYVDYGTTLKYNPAVANRNLLRMSAQSSTLFLNGGTLSASTTGLQLTKGTLRLDYKCFLQNQGATSQTEGIEFGNGASADDLAIDILPGGSINLLSGRLEYSNVLA